MKEQKGIRVLDLFFTVLIIAKIIFYYYLTEVTGISIVVGILTVLFFALILGLYLLSCQKRSTYFLIIGYTILSVLMFADSLYYSYFNQLPSVNQFAQMNSLVVVDADTIKFTMPPVCVALLFDVPFTLFYFVKRRGKIEFKMKQDWHRRVAKALVFLVVFVVFLAANPFNSPIVNGINRNELVVYHIYDVYKNIFGEKDNVIASEADVLKTLERYKTQNMETNLKGVAKGRNLIVIQVESLQNFPIQATYEGQELTPNLNKLVLSDSIYFDHYYQNIGRGNTSDAEFATNNSLYPVIEGESYRLYEQNTYQGLPWMLRDQGYTTAVFHGYLGTFWNREVAYVKQGFQDFISLEDFKFTNKIGFGLSDMDMFSQTIEHLKKMPQPFYSFIITLSCHYPYEMPVEEQHIVLNEEDKNTVFGNYLNGAHYSDQAIGSFVEALKANGLYDNSVIAIYGDHHALNAETAEIQKSMSQFLGKPYDYDAMLNIPLIINIPGLNRNETIHTIGGQVDFMPTIANLMDLPITSPFVFGQDLINKPEGFVAFVTYMLRGSFGTDETFMQISREGLYENSRFFGGKLTDAENLANNHGNFERAKDLLDASKYVLEHNLITP